MKKQGIQNYPTSDSPNHDAFESIVELYFEVKGYITSSGKWFWKKSNEKKQRGYQDIDVLAINGRETIIVSVSSNLDDKLTYTGSELNSEKALRIVEYFNRVVEYLTETKEYNWLIEKNRSIKKVIAVIKVPKNLKKYNNFLESKNIEILKFEDMNNEINEYLENRENLKIQNQILRIWQILYKKKNVSKSK